MHACALTVTSAWCIYPSTALPSLRAPTIPAPPRRPSLRRTRRRPRRLYHHATPVACQTPLSSSSSVDAPLPSSASQDAASDASATPSHASSSNGDASPEADASYPRHVQFGLLTDSVLELKWKNEESRQQFATTHPNSSPPSHSHPSHEASFQTAAPLSQKSVSPPSSLQCNCDDDISEDLSASDPYKAFANFTRIAAPTAQLGRDDQTILSPLTPFDEISLELQHRDLPYSRASIAHRLLRYTYARKNLADFMTYFQGEFDNYNQIAEQRSMGMLPREGGGHEHIHCSIVQLSPDLLFARYYFNGDPSIVFRSRLYRVTVSDKSDRGIIEMRIFRFYEETEQKLKAQNYDVSAIEWDDGDVYDWLEGCEVYWERYEPETREQDKASRQLGIQSGPRFVGYMKGGGCELYSREIGGRIRVMDDLLLTSEDLWVADRGFDEHSNFVYGNRRGVPYKMRRVRSGGPNAWTLSATAPAPEGYIP